MRLLYESYTRVLCIHIVAGQLRFIFRPRGMLFPAENYDITVTWHAHLSGGGMLPDNQQ